MNQHDNYSMTDDLIDNCFHLTLPQVKLILYELENVHIQPECTPVIHKMMKFRDQHDVAKRNTKAT